MNIDYFIRLKTLVIPGTNWGRFTRFDITSFLVNKGRILVNTIRLSRNEQLPQETRDALLNVLKNFDKARYEDFLSCALVLSEQNLHGLNLSNLRLAGAIFKDSILTKITMIDGHITEANFEGANLAGSVIRNSNASGANFCSAILTDAIFPNTDVREAIINSKTIMNDDTFADARNANQIIEASA